MYFHTKTKSEEPFLDESVSGIGQSILGATSQPFQGLHLGLSEAERYTSVVVMAQA
jgi:hypothetical protein